MRQPLTSCQHLWSMEARAASHAAHQLREDGQHSEADRASRRPHRACVSRRSRTIERNAARIETPNPTARVTTWIARTVHRLQRDAANL